ncbi:MAG: methylated-DNA--[protein]-cysteine S-methyltransferase [Deltaproteobacteria bacterium]|nr:methylated-DNA--[protein]-cysteine S-methyltransferase [Deltaproteobacteria bacterium]MBK8715535.1 methylated-DNA--[protein]-cysteine S-methyltransferase [Deltaproteobacteria bacterium]MBP7288436.1 methylated-DNA--[protein]-cysteine S-methyltransferase [Nannocystaceae bacterium]
MTALEQHIHAVVARIPPGAVASYGQVAFLAGSARAARAVGRALARVPPGCTLPWHRVVNARGAISLRGAAAVEQRRRLRREGVVVDDTGRIDLRRFGWRGDVEPRAARGRPAARAGTKARADTKNGVAKKATPRVAASRSGTRRARA